MIHAVISGCPSYCSTLICAVFMAEVFSTLLKLNNPNNTNSKMGTKTTTRRIFPKAVSSLLAGGVKLSFWPGKGEAHLGQIVQSGESMVDELEFILEGRDEGFVYWVDMDFSTRSGAR